MVCIQNIIFDVKSIQIVIKIQDIHDHLTFGFIKIAQSTTYIQ